VGIHIVLAHIDPVNTFLNLAAMPFLVGGLLWAITVLGLVIVTTNSDIEWIPGIVAVYSLFLIIGSMITNFSMGAIMDAYGPVFLLIGTMMGSLLIAAGTWLYQFGEKRSPSDTRGE
jgi:hypothetical protein